MRLKINKHKCKADVSCLCQYIILLHALVIIAQCAVTLSFEGNTASSGLAVFFSHIL